MRNLFALIGLAVVGLGGLGWYLGWYKVNVSKKADGNLQIQTNVDTQKLSGDSSAFFQKVGQLVSDKVQQAGQNGNSPPSAAPASTPGNTTTPTTQPPAPTPTIPGLPSIAPPGAGLNNLLPNIPQASPSNGKP